jgi:hypothetical protein
MDPNKDTTGRNVPSSKVRVARIEAHAPRELTRAELRRSLVGGEDAHIVWEVPGRRATSWLVQVPGDLAGDQLRRFARLQISADVIGFRRVAWI